MGSTEKRPEDIDKKSEQIIEETMKEIFDDLNNSEEFKEMGKDDEEIGQEEKEDKEDEQNDKEDGGDADTDRLSSDDGDFKTAGEELEEPEEEESEEEDLGDEEDSGEEDSDAQKAWRRHKRRKKIGIVSASVLAILVAVYFGIAFFFSSHFFFFTKINGVDFSMKNVGQVEQYMKAQVGDYVLKLQESDGGAEQIAGADISLEYVTDDQLKKLLNKQNHLFWIESLWDTPEIKAQIGVKYNKEELAAQIQNLQCMKAEAQTASVDAHPEFQNPEFVIIPEVVGTQIDTGKFNQAVETAINGFSDSIDLTAKDCYIKPKYVSDSQQVIAAKDAMNNYLRANITYDFNPSTEVVDASVISQWVAVDAEMNVTFNQDAVLAYIQTLAEKYDTRGKARTFTTGNGNVVTVEGGSYGWRIDQESEYNTLIANIQNAETVTREPEYSSRAATHGENDIGSTYAEVDLSNQQMYYVQDGQVVLQSGVVTGNPNKGNGTPAGTYSLAYKDRNQVLKGTKQPDGTYEYETPVAYWMPFNGGIGFHDATWQPTFGGSRYETNGSHGCVNMPYDMAAQLYDLISAGTPVVVHY